ncbi:MAG: type II toxin-antitoxin system VapC family toxin [Thermoproteota archaeon]|jgi:predicted nucleic acid-binding protein
MAQMVFLDTDVIIDYLENRNQEVRDIIAQLLLLHKKGKVILTTSVFNIAELIDKEFEIHFIGWCLEKRMSYDEIVKRLNRDEKLFKEVAEVNRKEIENKIKSFIFGKELKLLSFSGTEEYQELYDLIYKRNLRSQDALIATAALANKVTYFLSNDSNLISKIGDLLDAYNLRDKNLRDLFKSNVVEAI